MIAMTESSEVNHILYNIRYRLTHVMGTDRRFLLRELDLTKNLIKKTPNKKVILERLQALKHKVDQSIEKAQTRKARLPVITYPSELPIIGEKKKIIETIQNNQVVIITGETGSGKTTQIPKMCMGAGRGIKGMIGLTQPRRIATVTVCQRISQELGEEVGISTGYKIRFEDKTHSDNFIKVMTDGILLMETQADPYLNDYDTIIVDEAHERSTNIDFILGILKSLLNRRKDLKLIITSATIDPEKFSKAFNKAPIIEVSGRTYPVEIRYSPIDPELEEKGDSTYVDAAVRAIDQLKKERRNGDILIFMPTEQDIRETCNDLAARKYERTMILPLYARLSTAEQQKVFLRSKEQKIIVATNVAETSITIPDIKYVIDSGLARISEYNPGTRTNRLPIKPISKSSADQRKGRCGRVQNGICIRLYSEEDYEKRITHTPPEILRSNLAEVIMRMIALKIGDIHSFAFLDPPAPKNIKDGFRILQELDAIERGKKGFTLTRQGKRMARLPIDPRISLIILRAEEEGCIDEILIIASALSSQDPRERPLDREKEADAVHQSFVNPSSDFITLLNIWHKYHRAWDTLKTQNKMRKFCKENFLSYRRMREWKDIHQQIRTILKEGKILQNNIHQKLEGEPLYEAIHKSILSGYLSNIATKKEKYIYKGTKGRELMIFPGSGIFSRGKEWIVAAETLETSRLFARTVANINSEWLEKLGKKLCQSTYSDPHWEKNRSEVVAFEQVTLYGLVIVSGRDVSYGRINPEESSAIFIQSALIEGDIKASLRFLKHNNELIEQVRNMEDKIRRRDMLASEGALADFYKNRIGCICDIRSLQRMIRSKGGDDFLRMKEEDIREYFPEEELSLYPDEISIGNKRLKCSYRFDLGMQDDGVTIQIPSNIASTVSLEAADWHIPGLLREKITSLLKGLPKEFRKRLVPIPNTVDIILSDMQKDGTPILAALSKFIYEKFKLEIPATAWSLEELPDYLKTRFSIIDEKGEELDAGRDIHLLGNSFKQQIESSGFKKFKSIWGKTGLTTWDFGKLPKSINIKSNGSIEDVAYPALEKKEETVNLSLFNNKDEAETAHRKGLITLFEVHLKKELKFLRKYLSLSNEAKTWANYFGGPKYIEAALYKRTINNLFDHDIKDEEAFFYHAKSIKPDILSKGQEVLREAESVLMDYHSTRSILHNLETANHANKYICKFIAELRQDINHLIPMDFLEIYNDEKLQHLPRYLKGISIRAERGVIHLEKDQSKAAKLRILLNNIETLSNSLPPYTSKGKRNEIEKLSWMIEEYKLSIFAPELKTLYPVSPKRIEEKIKTIERMV